MEIAVLRHQVAVLRRQVPRLRYTPTDRMLITTVWGRDFVGDTRNLDVHVRRLRSKIEPDPAEPRHLVTVRGVGYKYVP